MHTIHTTHVYLPQHHSIPPHHSYSTHWHQYPSTPLTTTFHKQLTLFHFPTTTLPKSPLQPLLTTRLHSPQPLQTLRPSITHSRSLPLKRLSPALNYPGHSDISLPSPPQPSVSHSVVYLSHLSITQMSDFMQPLPRRPAKSFSHSGQP